MSPTGLSRAWRALGCALLSSVLAAGPSASETTTYAYDAAGRLIGAVDGSGKVVSYQYDDAGNRTQVSNEPFFNELSPSSWTSSSTSGTTGLTTPNAMRDGNYATAQSIHRTIEQAGPWIRAHFASPVYIDNTCVAPSNYSGTGPAAIEGALVEYSTDDGTTWLSGGTVVGAATGVCTKVSLRVTANSVRYRLTTTQRMAAGDIRFFSAGGGAPLPTGPVVTDKSLSVAYNTAGSIDLTPSSGAWNALALAGTAPSKGTVSFSNAIATYTPISGQSGTDSFGYQATGPGGVSNIGNVSVSIGQAATPPTVSDKTLILNQGGSGTVDLAPQGAWTSVQLVTDPMIGQIQPLNGTVTLSGSLATYTPNLATFYGNDRFSFTATGPGGVSQRGTVTVQVLPPPPVVSNRSVTYSWSSGAQSINLTPSGVWSQMVITQTPSIGSFSFGAPMAFYTVAANQSYTTNFKYKAIGPGGESNVATVTINVSLPTAPVAEAKTVTASANAPTSVTLTARSVSGDASPTFAISSGPSHGTVNLSGASATYTPSTGYSGADSFYYTASGLGGTGTPAKVDITVAQAPLSVSQTSTTYYRNRTAGGGWGPGSPTTVSVTGSGGSGNFSYAWEFAGGDATTSPVGGGCSATRWTDSTPLVAIEMDFYSTWKCKVTDNVSQAYTYSAPVSVHIYYAGNLSRIASASESESEPATAQPTAEVR